MDFLDSKNTLFLINVRNWGKFECVNFLMEQELEIFKGFCEADKKQVLISMDLKTLKSKIVEIIQKRK